MACSRGRGDGVPALLFRPVPACFIVLSASMAYWRVLMAYSSASVQHQYTIITAPVRQMSPQVLYAHRRHDEGTKFRVNNVTVRV